MIPKYIVDNAISGGWDGEWDNVLGPIKHMGNENACGDEHAILDPDFWMALGKEKGWPENWYIGQERSKDDVAGKLWLIGCPAYHAHRLYDLILRKASQEEIDDYWQSLTPTTR